MALNSPGKSCFCISAFFLCVILSGCTAVPSTSLRPTEPVTTTSIIRQPEGYSSDGQHLVIRPTEPVTTLSAEL